MAKGGGYKLLFASISAPEITLGIFPPKSLKPLLHHNVIMSAEWDGAGVLMQIGMPAFFFWNNLNEATPEFPLACGKKIKAFPKTGKAFNEVPRAGLEPASLAAYAPQTYVYTNSTTWAIPFF